MPWVNFFCCVKFQEAKTCELGMEMAGMFRNNLDMEYHKDFPVGWASWKPPSPEVRTCFASTSDRMCRPINLCAFCRRDRQGSEDGTYVPWKFHYGRADQASQSDADYDTAADSDIEVTDDEEEVLDAVPDASGDDDFGSLASSSKTPKREPKRQAKMNEPAQGERVVVSASFGCGHCLVCNITDCTLGPT